MEAVCWQESGSGVLSSRPAEMFPSMAAWSSRLPARQQPTNPPLPDPSCLPALPLAHPPFTVLALHFQEANSAPSSRPLPITRCMSCGALGPNFFFSASSIGSPAACDGTQGRAGINLYCNRCIVSVHP